jgi:hypothetical protein
VDRKHKWKLLLVAHSSASRWVAFLERHEWARGREDKWFAKDDMPSPMFVQQLRTICDEISHIPNTITSCSPKQPLCRKGGELQDITVSQLPKASFLHLSTVTTQQQSCPASTITSTHHLITTYIPLFSTFTMQSFSYSNIIIQLRWESALWSESVVHSINLTSRLLR